MLKLRLLLIGIACSCAFARNMERREEDKRHHHHEPSVKITDSNSTNQNPNITTFSYSYSSSSSSGTPSPADMKRVAGVIPKRNDLEVFVQDWSYVLDNMNKKLKELTLSQRKTESKASTLPETHKRSAGEPFVKNLPKSCCEAEDDDDEPNILCPEVRYIPPSWVSKEPEDINQKVEDKPEISGQENERHSSITSKDEEDEDEEWEEKTDGDILNEEPEVDELEEKPEVDKGKDESEKDKSEAKPEVTEWNETLDEDKSEEKPGPAETQNELKNNMDDALKTKILNRYRDQNIKPIKPLEDTLSMSFGFGNNFGFKIRVNGLENCKNQENVVGKS